MLMTTVLIVEELRASFEFLTVEFSIIVESWVAHFLFFARPRLNITAQYSLGYTGRIRRISLLPISVTTRSVVEYSNIRIQK